MSCIQCPPLTAQTGHLPNGPSRSLSFFAFCRLSPSKTITLGRASALAPPSSPGLGSGLVLRVLADFPLLDLVFSPAGHLTLLLTPAHPLPLAVPADLSPRAAFRSPLVSRRHGRCVPWTWLLLSCIFTDTWPSAFKDAPRSLSRPENRCSFVLLAARARAPWSGRAAVPLPAALAVGPAPHGDDAHGLCSPWSLTFSPEHRF